MGQSKEYLSKITTGTSENSTKKQKYLGLKKIKREYKLGSTKQIYVVFPPQELLVPEGHK